MLSSPDVASTRNRPADKHDALGILLAEKRSAHSARWQTIAMVKSSRSRDAVPEPQVMVNAGEADKPLKILATVRFARITIDAFTQQPRAKRNADHGR
jgi:hypothetical protein